MIDWLVETTFAVTILMLLVLAVRRPVAHFFGAGWAYALWLLPALRLVLPPLPFVENGLGFALPHAAYIPAVGTTAALLPSSDGSGQWAPILLALWAGGAAVFAVWQWLDYARFVRGLGAARRRGAPASFGGITVIESEAGGGPLAIGIIDRRIVVPPLFEHRYSPAEQRLALEHELIHHRRGDLWWNLAAMALLAFNWFNPIAWFAFRAFRLDQELACDAAVARRTPGELHAYASALVKSASRPGMVAACPLNHASLLKRRLKMMKHHRTSRLRTIGGGAALGLLLTAGIGLTEATSFAQEAKTSEFKIVKKVDKDGKVTVVDEAELARATKDCPEAQRMESDVATADGKHRTRIVLCNKGGNVDNATLIAALERTRDRVGNEPMLSAERQAEARAQIQAEIDRLRAR